MITKFMASRTFMTLSNRAITVVQVDGVAADFHHHTNL